MTLKVDEAQKILPHLLQFTSEHREEGAKLQKDMESFEEELGIAVSEIWAKPQEEESETVDTWVSRMEELEKSRRVNPIERVPKPEMGKSEGWKMRLYNY